MTENLQERSTSWLILSYALQLENALVYGAEQMAGLVSQSLLYLLQVNVMS